MRKPKAIDLQLLTQLEAAEMLGRSVRTLALWRRRRYGPAFHKIGGAVMYSPEDITEFLRGSRVRLEAQTKESQMGPLVSC